MDNVGQAKRWSSGLVFRILTFVFFFTAATVHAADPVRIMPLGDSITLGVTCNDSLVGYRQGLFLDLIGEGYDIDFVGSLANGELAYPIFDPDHEGHSGWRDDQVGSAIYVWLDTLWRAGSAPDVILLHIGTNALDTDTSDVVHLLDEIDRFEVAAAHPITVVLAQIIPKINSSTNRALTSEFNDNLALMVQSRNDDIVLVDMESALEDSDLCDGVHPNSSGYSKMVQVWFQALIGLLPPPTEHPDRPVIVSRPPITAQVGLVYSYPVRAANNPTAFSLLTSPAGMEIDSSSGLITWTPEWTGDAEVVVEAENEYGMDTQEFTIQVASSSLDPSGVATYVSGASVGYYLWRESNGNWRLRLNSDGLRRNMSGTISSSGSIQAQPFSFESNDTMNVSGGTVTFSCWLSSSHDGIDFTVAPGSTVTFDLKIDNQHVPSRVFVGSSLSSPAQIPFQLVDGGGGGTPVETAPVITSTPLTTVQSGSTYAYDVQATGNPAPEFTLLVSPADMDIDSATGLITWTPQSAGSFDVAVRAANAAGTDTQSFTIQVTEAPLPGELDPSGVASYVSGASVGYYLWRESNGTWRLRLNSDGLRRNMSGTISSSGSIQAQPFSLESNDTLNVSGGTVTFSCWLSSSHDGIDFTVAPGSTVTFDLRVSGSYDPSLVFVGSSLSNPAQIPFQLVDGGGGGTPVETAPVITSTPLTTVQSGSTYAYDVQATGNPAPEFTLLVSPADMDIDSATGLITWTPQSAGSFDVAVRAANAAGTDTQSFTIQVTEAPLPGELDPSGVASYVSGASVGYYLWRESNGTWRLRLNSDGLRRNMSGTISSSGSIQAQPFSLESNDTLNVSGGTVTFSCWLSSSHDGIDFTVAPGSTVTFDLRVSGSYDPSLVFVGSSLSNPAQIPFQLVDGGGGGTPVETAPVITSTPLTTVQSGSTYAYDVQATGNPAPEFILLVSPADMDIDSATGLITWTPQSAGSFDVAVRAANAAGTDTQSFTIQVTEAPLPGELDPSGVATYVPGESVGYYLWRESNGNWRLRLNSDGLRRNMSGTISSSGSIQAQPFSLESNDTLYVSGGTVTFSCWLSSSHDGIDFTVAPGSTITFDLRVSGSYEPTLVFVGGSGGSPTAIPFSLPSE
jgi:hypothetical protein